MLPLGTVVRNLHTGDEGRIIAIDDDMAIVELFDDNDRYPIPMQSLVRSEEFFGTIDFDRELSAAHRHKPKNKQNIGNLSKNTARNNGLNANIEKNIEKKQETSVNFKPNLAEMLEMLVLSFILDENTDNFMVFLVNNTNYSIKFEIKCENSNEMISSIYWDLKNIIAPFDFYAIGELPRLALNDSPKFVANMPTFHKNIATNLRAKNIFKSQQVVLLDAHDLKNTIKKTPENEQKITSNEQQKPNNKQQATKNKQQKHGKLINLHDLQAFASFPLEIDLHAEQLFGNRQPDANDILRLQLQHFEIYLEKAIRFNIERVHIIHGKGSGKLREAVHQILKRNSHVSSFEIDSDLRYGGGATEVKF